MWKQKNFSINYFYMCLLVANHVFVISGYPKDGDDRGDRSQ